MPGRRDARFIDVSLPTKPSAGYSRQEWDQLISPYYPTSFNDSIKQTFIDRLRQFGVDPNQSIPTDIGTSIRLNLNSLDGLSESALTLYSLGQPLHSGPLFYPVFNKGTRDAIEKRLAFNNYSYKLDYCLIDRIHKNKSVQTDTLYRGVNIPFTFKEGDTFRFHQFTSASLDETEARRFFERGGTMYYVKYSPGLDMKKYSQYPDEGEYLIHPFQEFTVNKVERLPTETRVALHVK